jgi:hypothetical protein
VTGRSTPQVAVFVDGAHQEGAGRVAGDGHGLADAVARIRVGGNDDKPCAVGDDGICGAIRASNGIAESAAESVSNRL